MLNNTNKSRFLLLFVCFLSFFSTDITGQPVTWQKVLNNNYGSAQKIQQTFDGGYILVGSDIVTNQNKIYLVKLDFLGNILWTKYYGDEENQGNWVEQTTDGGYIIGGATTGMGALGESDAYLIKTDPLGNLQWQKLFSYSDLEQCKCVKQTQDGGYILSCRTTPLLNSLMYIKTDSSGNLQWRKVYQNNFEIFAGEIEIVNGGYASTGRIGINNSIDMYAIRLNNLGDTLWLKTYGGNNAEEGYTIDEIDNTGYIIGGYSKSFNINNKPQSYVVRIDINGNLLWQRTYSNIGNEICNSIRYIDNKGFVLSGISDSLGDFLVYKAKIRFINSNGNQLYENSFLPSPDYAFFNTIELTDDNGFICAGGAAYASNNIKMYVVKTDSIGGANPIGILNQQDPIPGEYVLFQNYPNPFNPVTNIRYEIPLLRGVSGEDGRGVSVTIKIYDILGKEIFSKNEFKKAGNYEVQFDGSDYASGIYYYQLVVGELPGSRGINNGMVFSDTKKMVLLK